MLPVPATQAAELCSWVLIAGHAPNWRVAWAVGQLKRTSWHAAATRKPDLSIPGRSHRAAHGKASQCFDSPCACTLMTLPPGRLLEDVTAVRAWLWAALRCASREKAPCSLPSLPRPGPGGRSSNLRRKRINPSQENQGRGLFKSLHVPPGELDELSIREQPQQIELC